MKKEKKNLHDNKKRKNIRKDIHDEAFPLAERAAAPASSNGGSDVPSVLSAKQEMKKHYYVSSIFLTVQLRKIPKMKSEKLPQNKLLKFHKREIIFTGCFLFP